jgi:hypothetical protein
MNVESDKLLATHEELRQHGVSSAILARLDALREEQIASGLSPEAFATRLQDRAKGAQEKLERSQRGWGLPILSGFLAMTTLITIGHGSRRSPSRPIGAR